MLPRYRQLIRRHRRRAKAAPFQFYPLPLLRALTSTVRPVQRADGPSSGMILASPLAPSSQSAPADADDRALMTAPPGQPPNMWPAHVPGNPPVAEERAPCSGWLAQDVADRGGFVQRGGITAGTRRSTSAQPRMQSSEASAAMAASVHDESYRPQKGTSLGRPLQRHAIGDGFCALEFATQGAVTQRRTAIPTLSIPRRRE